MANRPEFDPYHKWLGIPPDEQPANSYRLLGLKDFESDPDVIDAAANRQMTYVKQCGTGAHSALSQKILNELSVARIRLLNKEKKAAYDQKLKSKLRVAAVPPPVEGPKIDVAEDPIGRRNRSRKLPIFLGIGMAAATFATAAFIEFPGSGEIRLPGVGVSEPENALSGDSSVSMADASTDQTSPDGSASGESTSSSENPAKSTSDEPDKTAGDSPDTKTVAARQDDNTVDVLKAIDLYRDVIFGEWALDNGVLVAAPADGKSKQIKLPITVPAEYDLELEIEGLEAGDPLTIGLVGGSSRFAAYFNHQPSADVARASGLGLVKGLPPNSNETAQRKILFQGGKTSLRFIVRNGGVQVLCNGVLVIEFAGEFKDLSLHRDWDLWRGNVLFLGPSSKEIRYTKVAFKPISPSGSSSPGGAAEKTVDLLAMVDLKRDVKGGDIQWNDQRELVKNSTDGAIVTFPFSPPEGFDLALNVTKTQGNDALSIGVTVDGHRCMLTVDSINNTRDGVTQLDNRVDHPEVKLEKGPFFTLNKESEIICQIRKDSLRALFDGREIIQWQGDPTRLSMLPLTDRNVGPGAKVFLVMNNATYKFRSVKVTPAASVLPPSKDPPSVPVETGTIAGKQPIPKGTSLRDAQKAIEELYAGDLSDARQPNEKLDLARKILAQAIRTTNEPTARYVMLRKAQELSIESGIAGTALDCINEINRDFVIDVWDEREDVVSAAVPRARLPDQNRDIIRSTMPVIIAATEAEQFETATKLGALMITAVRKIGDKKMSAEIFAMRSQVVDMRKEYDEAQEAAAKLKEMPDDPNANRTWGTYLCINRNDWAAGLPYLAKSGDEKLEAAVKLDLASPQDAEERARVADAWWDWIESTRRKENQRFVVAAYYWYRKAAIDAAGLTKVKVEKRLKEIGTVPQPRTDTSSPQVATTPSATVTQPRGYDAAYERSAARFMLDAGADVTVSINGEERKLSKGDSLPAGDFVIAGIRIEKPSYSTGKNDPIQGNDLQRISRLSGIKYLQLFWINLGDAALSHLTFLTTLEDLQLGGCGITDEGLKTIGTMRQLKRLLMSYSSPSYFGGITSAGLVHLEELTNLEVLSLVACPVDDAGMPHLRPLVNLTELHLFDTGISDAAFPNFYGMRKLKLLNAGRTKATKEGTDAFWAKWKEYKDVGPSTSFSPGFDPAIERAVVVRVLDHGGYVNVKVNGKEVRVQDQSAIPSEPFTVSYITTNRSKKIVDGDVELIARCSNLEQLALGLSSVTNAGLQYLPPLTSLKLLNLYDLGVTDEGLKNVQNLKAIEQFDIFNSKVSDAGLSAIAGLTNMSALNLQNVQISDAGLVHLSGMTKLKKLLLSGSQVTGSGFQELQDLQDLVHLEIAKTPFNDEGLRYVSAITNLEQLVISYTKVSGSGLQYVRGLTRLRYLAIDDLNLTDDDLKNVAGLTNLTKLRLYANPITDAGLVHLYNLKKLNHLVLQDTKVTEAGVSRLQQALPDCQIFQ